MNEGGRASVAATKTWVYSATKTGLENELQLVDRPTPSWVKDSPRGKHAVQVICAALNPVDYKLPESPIESRVARVPKPASPGMDFCGRLVSDPQRIVFGRLNWPAQYGSLATYVLADEKDFVDLPPNCTTEQAAGVGIAALTAYQSIVPFVQTGSRLVVFGGSGGVGTFSIQIAKLIGCHVVAVCSGKNEQFCKDLGADETVDYTKRDVIAVLASMLPFDLAVDNVGNNPSLHRQSQAFLKHTGRFVLVSGMLGSLWGVLSMAESLLRPTWLGGPVNRYNIVLCQSNKSQLQQIAEWMADGSLRTVIDEVFDYSEVPKAFAKLRQGRARGKIVVRVSS